MSDDPTGSDTAKRALGYSILALFCGPLGIVLGPIAIVRGLRVRRESEGGRGTATVALVIGVLATILGIAVLGRIGWNIWTGNYPPTP